MTKKHFEIIAACLAASRRPDDDAGNATIERLAECMAVRFGAINPRFNTALFLAACRAA